MVTRKLCPLTIILSLLVFSNLAFALEGAGPDDVYGGPSQNRNICTPYHFIPEERLTLSYQWKSVSYSGERTRYRTQGNNIAQVVEARGTYTDGEAWESSDACYYPRDSGFKMIRGMGIFGSAIGEFNGREPKDTTWTSAGYTDELPGRISTDLGYIEDLDPWADKYKGGTQWVHVSTRPSDLEDWPEEFCDGSGEPIVISNEDVVIVHCNSNVWTWRPGLEQQDVRAEPFVEMQGRVMSFSAAIARDIQFYDYKLINKSQFHFFPDVGTYDLEEYMFGPGTIFTLGSGGDQRVAYVPKYRLGFTYQEDFSDPLIEKPSPMGGYTVIRALESPDPETGRIEEGVLTSFSGNVPGGSWNYPAAIYTLSRALIWKTRKGEPDYAGLQDPGLGDDPESELPIISRSNLDSFFFFFYSDNPLCPGDTTNLVYALVCAFPSVEDPAALAGTHEGLASVAAQLVQNAATAHDIYESGYPCARLPAAPGVTLTPGDRQVTITWDNISEGSRDPFYDYYGGANDYREYDFQGYRVYRSTTGQLEDAELIAQFDLQDGVVLGTAISADGTDTLGISRYDPAGGAAYGLGLDTGINYDFTDTGLNNAYPYYYAVTAYDWNGRDLSDLSTMFSLENTLIFNPDNKAIPLSNPEAYKRPLIWDETSDLVLLDGSGKPLSTEFRDIPVEDSTLAEEAIPTNAMRNTYIFMQDAEQTYSTCYIVIDSIVGEPDEVENPATVPDYHYKAMNRVYLSLLDKAGSTLFSDSKMVEFESGILSTYFGWKMVELFPGHGALFFVHPELAPEVDLPFNIEIDIPPFSTALMVWNDVEVLTGTTPVEDIDIKHGYINGSNSVPIGYRAADIELRWQEVGDSLTLEVWDVTHNVEIPYRGMPGSSWSFFSSWSRFILLSSKMRSELTEEDFSKAGSSRTASRTPSRAGRDVKYNIFVCGMQIKAATPEATVPQYGDVWLIRSNYGTMPEEGTGFLSQVDEYGDQLIRPPVPRVRYEITTGGTAVPPKSCDFSGDGTIAINDVITFLLLARDNPRDPMADWNDDGRYEINDAIALLRDIQNGTCPDALVHLSSAVEDNYLLVNRLESLSQDDIAYLEQMMSQMNLTPGQEASFLLALYGESDRASLPKTLSLAQNVPNPFNPATTISYSVPEGTLVKVTLKVYDIRGRLVRTLVDEVREPGSYTVFWDGKDDNGWHVSSGVYLYRMRSGDFLQTRKMVLLK